MIDFATHPERYRHWQLKTDGPVATLRLNVQEDGGLDPAYKLKLNSYDLSVDIELYGRRAAPALRAPGSRRRGHHLGPR